jgi:hypothetical protein
MILTFDADTEISRFDGDVSSLNGLISIHIPSTVEVICEGCFWQRELRTSVTFDFDTKVLQFNGHAFCESGLTSLYPPSIISLHLYPFID